jgi:hypothetical protein
MPLIGAQFVVVSDRLDIFRNASAFRKTVSIIVLTIGIRSDKVCGNLNGSCKQAKLAEPRLCGFGPLGLRGGAVWLVAGLENMCGPRAARRGPAHNLPQHDLR